MKIQFEGQQLDVPDNIANQSLSEQELKKILDVPEDNIVFTREEGNRSKSVKDSIKLKDGMKLGSTKDYFEG